MVKSSLKVQIAVCDDDVKDREGIVQITQEFFDSIGSDCIIEEFESGAKFLANMDRMLGFDAVLLDIDMPQINGISVASKIIKYSQDMNIIFITNREEFVFEAIHYRPFRFVRKQNLKEELNEAVSAVMKKVMNEIVMCDFVKGEEDYRIPIKDVIYLEVIDHIVYIHTKDVMKRVRGTLADFEKKIGAYGFLRINISFLVNVRSIYAINSRYVILDDGMHIRVSRKNVEWLKTVHANYVRRFIRGIDL